jgi:PAS domain S-box-containing protein
LKKSENTNSQKEIESEIKKTEKKLSDLRRKLSEATKYDNVFDSPHVNEELLLEVQDKFSEYFNNQAFYSSEGKIEINNERYILMRSSSISFDFFQGLMTLLEDKGGDSAFEIAADMLYDIAHMIGKKDAYHYHKSLNLDTPINKVSAGPIHFAFTGWAKVEILPESNPVANENYILKYHHKNSFEAEAWIKAKKVTKEAVCAMSAGYSAGWSEESYGIPLIAVEVACKAKNDDNCTFIMAPPNKISNYLEKEKIKQSKLPNFFERNLIKRRLQEKEELLKQAERFSKIGSWTYYYENHDVIWSDEVYSIFEVDKESTNELFKVYHSRIDDKTRKELDKYLSDTKNKGLSYEIRHVVHCANNVKKWVVASGNPILDNDNNVIGIKGLIQDITKNIVGTRELDHFFNVSIDLQCIANKEGYFVKVSPSWSNLLGYTEKELLSTPYLNFVHPDDQKITNKEAENLRNDVQVLNFENRYITKSGKTIDLSWNSTIDNMTGLVYCTVRNITKEKRAKEKLLSNLSEKDTLLREIHHRVKNNLQIISSLLSLQSGLNSKNIDLTSLYTDSQNRIKSMAAIHEMFYKSENLDKVDFSMYLKKLISDLIHTFRGPKNEITLDLKTTKVWVDLDTAIPLGLIINEIITNSLKHGIKPGKNGVISVNFEKINEESLKLIIGDNGIGTTNIIEKNNESTLGIMLINSLVEQLDGTIEQLKDTPGTVYEIIFKQVISKNQNE